MSPCRHIAFPEQGVSVRPAWGRIRRYRRHLKAKMLGMKTSQAESTSTTPTWNLFYRTLLGRDLVCPDLVRVARLHPSVYNRQLATRDSYVNH